MAETIEIPVIYRKEELSIKGHVIHFGYVNHIIVDLNGISVTIERDEEGNYRALSDADKFKQTKVDVELVEAIINVLQAL